MDRRSSVEKYGVEKLPEHFCQACGSKLIRICKKLTCVDCESEHTPAMGKEAMEKFNRKVKSEQTK
jgi:hypothetical protein